MPTETRQPQRQETCIWAILALIFAFLFPLLGLIFGIIALSKIKNNPRLGGHGLAVAGLVISIIFLVIALIFFIVVFILGAAFLTAAGSMP